MDVSGDNYEQVVKRSVRDAVVEQAQTQAELAFEKTESNQEIAAYSPSIVINQRQLHVHFPIIKVRSH